MYCFLRTFYPEFEVRHILEVCPQLREYSNYLERHKLSDLIKRNYLRFHFQLQNDLKILIEVM